MDDQGENGLRYKLKTLYKSIINKAEDYDFTLIVTSYTGFFNHDTTDYDQNTFYYWRNKLNQLVGQLNSWIEAAVQDANSEIDQPEFTMLTSDRSLTRTAGTGSNLPEATTCQQMIGSDPDPYETFLCLASITIKEDPNGPEAWSYGDATQAIRDGDVNSQDINDWYDTRQIRTFHPRSPGMGLDRDAITEF
ncbi:hypothetical protein CNMCM8694_003348 [Aspergillus lentulus]|nr:hypothetical protein CNMCM8060_005413 [Aspergillus lentulus]KAF4199599.1 hypothetical protein CNMCM8694_003348 [Aspergillus lentulus]